MDYEPNLVNKNRIGQEIAGRKVGRDLRQ